MNTKEITGNNNESRKALGMPLADAGFVAAAPIATVEVTKAADGHEGTTAKLVEETTLLCGTVVKHYA
jgi:hypothetical protein